MLQTIYHERGLSLTWSRPNPSKGKLGNARMRFANCFADEWKFADRLRRASWSICWVYRVPKSTRLAGVGSRRFCFAREISCGRHRTGMVRPPIVGANPSTHDRPAARRNSTCLAAGLLSFSFRLAGRGRRTSRGRSRRFAVSSGATRRLRSAAGRMGIGGSFCAHVRLQSRVARSSLLFWSRRLGTFEHAAESKSASIHAAPNQSHRALSAGKSSRLARVGSREWQRNFPSPIKLCTKRWFVAARFFSPNWSDKPVSCHLKSKKHCPNSPRSVWSHPTVLMDCVRFSSPRTNGQHLDATKGNAGAKPTSPASSLPDAGLCCRTPVPPARRRAKWRRPS